MCIISALPVDFDVHGINLIINSYFLEKKKYTLIGFPLFRLNSKERYT